MYAALRDRYEICQMLLEHGAIVDFPLEKVSNAILPIYHRLMIIPFPLPPLTPGWLLHTSYDGMLQRKHQNRPTNVETWS